MKISILNFQILTSFRLLSCSLLRACERDALGLFLEKKVSGAPVVNSEGGLIGVLSMTDIIWVESTEAMQEVEFPFYPTSSVEEDEEEVEEGRNIAADQILTSAE